MECHIVYKISNVEFLARGEAYRVAITAPFPEGFAAEATRVPKESKMLVDI
jgi:hypothetical protein